MNAHDQISTPFGLASFTMEWFDVAVPAWFAWSMSSDAARHRERWETAAGPYIWVKNRLLEHHMLPDAGRNTPDDSHSTATLHVGFLSIFETPEMLNRLRNERVTDDASPARSRFARCLGVTAVTPIDTVAGRVCRGDGQ